MSGLVVYTYKITRKHWCLCSLHDWFKTHIPLELIPIQLMIQDACTISNKPIHCVYSAVEVKVEVVVVVVVVVVPVVVEDHSFVC